MAQLLIAVIILLIGSAFCSSAEAAMLSVNKTKLQTKAKKSPQYTQYLELVEDISGSVSAVVILNNIFNISGTFLIGILATQVLPNQAFFVGFSVSLTVLIIIFGEILPKSFGERYSLTFGAGVSPIVALIKIFMLPVLSILESINQLIFGVRELSHVSEDEISMLIDQAGQNRSIEEDEHRLIRNVFSLNDKSALDIMTPRVNIEALDGSLTINDQRDTILNSPFSRLPIYDDDYDTILGYALTKELVIAMERGEGDCKLQEFMNSIVAIKETTKVDTLLVIFQKKRQHIALVQDQFGGTSGLVTLEDALEQLVGEIVDETDRQIDMREISISQLETQ